jgi:hypothetical protein
MRELRKNSAPEKHCRFRFRTLVFLSRVFAPAPALRESSRIRSSGAVERQRKRKKLRWAMVSRPRPWCVVCLWFLSRRDEDTIYGSASMVCVLLLSRVFAPARGLNRAFIGTTRQKPTFPERVGASRRSHFHQRPRYLGASLNGTVRMQRISTNAEPADPPAHRW